MRRTNLLHSKLLRVLGILLGVLALSATGLMAVLFTRLNQTNGELISTGQKRTYLLYVPRSYQPDKPTPLVISIHGYAEWPAHQAEISRWNELADQVGFHRGLPVRDRLSPALERERFGWSQRQRRERFG